MENLFEAIPYINAYKPAFLVLGLLSLVVLVQSFLTAPLAFAKEEQTPGMPLKFDHSRLSFRAVRTYQNSAESFPAFVAACLVAIVAGASPFAINAAAGVYLLARLLFWGFYYSGFGRVAGGPRTMAFVVCLLANIVIAVAALMKLLWV
ncbi:MAPEG family protein [Roseibium sp. HPY-6]|uniref:MAPEG family protein n=1 Tax=Roseibium sp. HPY-6 TaxID=3229852 RepID=UPI00338DA7DB